MLVVFIGINDCIDMAFNKAIPAYISANERGINMHNLTFGDFGFDARLDRSLEYFAKPLSSPALAYTSEGRMIGQCFVETIAAEPPDGDVDLGFPHQPSIVNDPQQEARKHQA